MGLEPSGAELHQERRRQLIERLRAAGIQDLAVLHAFDRVPRHLFVPDLLKPRAYLDQALPLGHGVTISRPSTHARYLVALQLDGSERVLEIGTGSGYQTGLLAMLAERVYSVERIPALARAARERLERLGFTNVLIRAGDGTYGWRRYAPYDVILVTAAAREVPNSLIDQLGTTGRLLVPLGTAETQELVLFTRRGTDLEKRGMGQVRFVELKGDSGFEEPGERFRRC